MTSSGQCGENVQHYTKCNVYHMLTNNVRHILALGSM